MIYTLTLNPAIDLVMDINNLKIGETNRCKSENYRPGGKGINVSLVLNSLGVNSVALGFIGGGAGKLLADKLDSYNCRHDFIKVKQGETRINVKLRESGVITEINAAGLVPSMDEIKELNFRLGKIQKGDILVLSGALPNGVNQNFYADIMSRLSQNGVIFIVDTHGQALIDTLPLRPFLIKPNHQELSELFSGETITDMDKLTEYARHLNKMGAQNVLVSMGERGAFLIASDGNVYRAEAEKGDVIDTVGAGDSMVAGFIHSYQRENDYYKALTAAVRIGTRATFSDWLPI